MPGVYRVEYASTSRAGCKGSECKAGAIKIQKGELRFGVFVTIKDYQTWQWKHWGCVTPQQIHNLKESVEDEPEKYLDGYTELEQFDQARIAKAIEEGHVADDDWRGDVEVNRPGQKGYRTPASKKRTKEEAQAQATKNGDGSPSKPAEKKKRGRAKKEADVDSGDEPPLKKPKAEAQTETKVKIEDDLDEEPQLKKGRKKASKSFAKAEAGAEVKVEGDEDNAAVPATKKRGAARKSAAPKVKIEENDDEKSDSALRQTMDDEAEAEEAPKAKRGRKPNTKSAEDSAAPALKGSGKTKQKKAPISEEPAKPRRTSGRTTRSSAA